LRQVEIAQEECYCPVDLKVISGAGIPRIVKRRRRRLTRLSNLQGGPARRSGLQGAPRDLSGHRLTNLPPFRAQLFAMAAMSCSSKPAARSSSKADWIALGNIVRS